MKKIVCVFVMFIWILPIFSGDFKDKIEKYTRPEMQAVLEFLADDQLEGRAPGTRGGDLTEIYVKSLFKLVGLQPAFPDGEYLQPFELKGFQTQKLLLEAGPVALDMLRDIVGNATLNETGFSLEGEMVFAGFGINSTIFKWNDYQGVNVKNKIVFVRAGDPGMFNPGEFEGKNLTYFGRWSYKIEEAARAGAMAILLVHTDATAGYGWNVVQNSWTGEKMVLPDSLNNNLKFMGWISEEGFKKILKIKGIDCRKLYKKALSRKFRAENLKINVKISGQHQARTLTARNVVGVIPGSSGKSIVFSAHIDHLGRDLALNGDQIFNGAIDNASPVATLVLLAKAFIDSGYQTNHTLVFLGCHAEEKGLLGSRYYACNTDCQKIIADITFESTPVWEKSKSFFAIGGRFSTLEDTLEEILQNEGLEYEEFSMTEQGFFYRSDQYPFAQQNVPAIWLSAGEQFTGGVNHLRNFFTGNYHTVRDEFDPAWELESLKQTVKVAALLADQLNRNPKPPAWKIPLPFPLDRQ